MSNYFTLFELDEKFEINDLQLENTYIAIQSVYHPDRFFSSVEREIALSKIKEINQAYHILKSPINRAIYLLSLKEIVIEDKMPSQMLSEIFSLQEEISDAEDKKELILSLYNYHLDALGKFFKNIDNGSIAQIKKTLFLLRYLSNIKNDFSTNI